MDALAVDSARRAETAKKGSFATPLLPTSLPWAAEVVLEVAPVLVMRRMRVM